jgi:hypothetical protein
MGKDAIALIVGVWRFFCEVEQRRVDATNRTHPG